MVPAVICVAIFFALLCYLGVCIKDRLEEDCRWKARIEAHLAALMRNAGLADRATCDTSRPGSSVADPQPTGKPK